MIRMGVLPAIVVAAAAVLSLSCQATAQPREPITIYANPRYLSMSLDDVIAGADAIVIGDVTAAAPARWDMPNGQLPPGTTIRTVPRGLTIFVDSDFRA